LDPKNAVPTREAARAIVRATIEEINAEASGGRTLSLDESAPLFGKAGALDSLGLVNLIVRLEENVEKETGLLLSLADERALERHPFATLGRLADHVLELWQEAAGRS
jgi:acyl carrier protein